MNILVTGAKGMVGIAVCANQKISVTEITARGILRSMKYLNMTFIDEKSLLQAVDVAVEMNKNGDMGIPVPDYTDENVSDKVVKIIQSYTGVVNKMVWRKPLIK